MNGPGYALYTNLYSEDWISKVRDQVYGLAQTEARKTHEISDETGHNNIYTVGKRSTAGDDSNGERKDGIRVWNLLNKGQEFESLVQEPKVMDVCDRILGQDHCIGSYAANVMHPGTTRQLPHLDYPYWDFNSAESWPRTPSSSSMMNVQSVLMLDDFTIENGATAVLPYSQKECRWPDLQEFETDSIRVTGSIGTLFLFTGLLHHAAMDNTATTSRAGILGQYLPKYVRPMEDPSVVRDEVRSRASDRLQTLLGMNQPYPKDFDQ